ncbi:DMT family transporter [Planomicrobium sp. CPCC 101079]|uniref:DMT family transporter n=1 Tax=Planomicrobium sp. CPCC 101079 TaxID=2599618 RepID=UPI0011B64616|nr:DMT family transporter [Planomicrobium sp. CPCC 101079]TWT03643.1 DMT family transporter [Planomicrobium sp. CPCC 101079]
MPLLALFSLSILWGSTFYLTKMLLPDFHPVSIVFFRCLFGAAALLPFFLWNKKKNDFKNLPALLLITLMSAGVPWTIMSLSIKNLDTTITSVLNATGPIIGMVISSLFLKIKIHKQEIISVFIGFTGIVLAFFAGSSTANEFKFSSAALFLFSVSVYSLSAVFVGKFLKDCSVYTLSFVSMIVGSVFSGFFMLGIEPMSHEALLNVKSFILFILLGMFNSGFGNVIFYYLVKSGGAIFALLIMYLMPFTTILLGVFLLQEPLAPGTLLALFFVLAGLFLSQRRKIK